MSRGWPSQLRSQVGYDLLGFRRNPAATFFTVILPLIFLLLFTSIFGNETLDSRNGLRAANFYVPGILFPSFDPFLQATPMPWGHWAVIAAWGVLGAVITVKRFRWTPWDG